MKYFSELTKQLYESEEELLDAEASMLTIDEECDSCDDLTTETIESLKTKQLDEFERIEKELANATAEYKEATEKVKELSTQYLNQVNELLEGPTKRLNEAKKAKHEYGKKQYETLRFLALVNFLM